MKKHLSAFLSLIFLFQISFSQQGKEYENENALHYRKNAIYGSLGIPVGYCLLNFERQLFRINQDKIAIDMSFSYGVYANLGEDGQAAIFCSDIIFGKNKHHLETDIGVAFNRTHAYQGSKPLHPYLPCVKICYRIQQKNKPFLLKTGLGFPEGAFVCIGFAF